MRSWLSRRTREEHFALAVIGFSVFVELLTWVLLACGWFE